MKEKLLTIKTKVNDLRLRVTPVYLNVRATVVRILKRLDVIVKTDRIRATFYLLPFFVLWIIPITWEKKPEIVRAGYRSMVLFFIFVIALALIYFSSGLLFLALPKMSYYVRIYAFSLHIFIVIAYVVFSLLLAIGEYINRSIVSSKKLDMLYGAIISTAQK